MSGARHAFTPHVDNRVHALIERLAPAEPPCFESRQQWVQWLQWSDAACDSEARPLNYRPTKGGVSKPAEFNHALSFCADCTPAYRTEMLLQERCKPQHLEQFKPLRPEKVIPPEKQCVRCGEVKPRTAFYANAHMLDGTANKCMVCTKNDLAAKRNESAAARAPALP